MRILSKEEVEADPGVLKGKVFVYPTDTIYGIGCDATNGRLVACVRDLKGRETKPFSVIAPSTEWIRQNCDVTKDAEAWLAKLPGPYTLILQMKRHCVARETAEGTLGVRIPDHWISKAVAKLGSPIVTTSVNMTGKEPMTSLDDMEPSIKAGVDIIIDDGERRGKPSMIVDLTKGKATVKER